MLKITTKQIFNITSIIFLITFFTCCNEEDPDSSFSKEQLEMLSYVNNLRVDKGSPKVKLDTRLNCAALNQVEYMNKTNDINHIRKIDTLKNPIDRAHHCGWSKENNYVGENIAFRPQSDDLAQCFFKQWEKSEGHYNNMIRSTHTVFGYAQICEKNVCYGVQLFGTD